MQISVVIATYNRHRLLSRTLPTVLTQTVACEDYEVIVVVDGSTDGTAKFLRDYWDHPCLRVVGQPNLGQAAAINAGLTAARGHIILFLDDDIICPPNLLEEHLHAHCDSGSLVYGPVLLAPESRPQLSVDWARQFCDDFFRRLTPEAEGGGWFSCMACANSSAPRASLLVGGGLDPTFTRGNDLEFGMRLRKDGLRFKYQPSAVVHQIFVKTTADIVAEAEAEGRAAVRLCRTCPELRARMTPARFWEEPAWKRLLKQAVVRTPFSLAPLLALPCRLAESLRPIPGMRRLGLWLLGAQRGIVCSRGVVREAGSWAALRREFGMRLPVLMYHSVGRPRPGGNPSLTISTSDFERQMRWLARHGYTPISVADWLAWLGDGKPLPERPVLLTFDDAYADITEHALPLLRELGFTATVFVVTSQVGGTNLWDQVAGIAPQELMSAEQIRYWAAHGMDFGSHSRTHADLRTLAGPELQAELRGSRDELAAIVGKPVLSFAYPFGYVNESVCRAAGEVFEAAFTCEEARNDLRTERNRLRRANMTPRYAWLDPGCALRFGFNPLVRIRMRAGLARRRFFRHLLDSIRSVARRSESTGQGQGECGNCPSGNR